MSSRVDGGAMLPDPLTPPHDNSSTGSGDGAPVAIKSNETSLDQNSSLATPTSNANMGLDLQDETSDLQARSDLDDLSDEDQDMSDGGAALALTPSHHAEQLNAEMDMMDAEIMGAENLFSLHLDSHFQPADVEGGNFFFPEDVYPGPFASLDAHSQDEDISDGYMEGAAEASDLPTTMSEVSQQLQHIHEGQEHGDLIAAPEDQHTDLLDHSTTPFHLPISPLTGVGTAAHSSMPEFVSMADLTTPILPVTPGSQNAPHLWQTAGWTPSPAMDVLVSEQGHHDTSHLPSWAVLWDDDNMSDADVNQVDDQFNLSLGDFLYQWGMSASRDDVESKKRTRGPALPALHKQRFMGELGPIQRCDLQGDKCDIQRINWKELGVSRLEARQVRRQTYRNYTNLRINQQWHVGHVWPLVHYAGTNHCSQPRLNGARLTDHENFFRFRRMDFDHDVHLSHFQLRNLVAAPSRDHVFYAGRSKILQSTPIHGDRSCGPSGVAMDLTDPIVQPFHAFPGGVQISTLAAAHDVLIAGGFCGEYGVVNLKAQKDTKHTEGLITDHINSITNHVQLHLSRSSSLPQCTFSSNDNGVRVLDINTNKFVAEYKYEHAINSTAISPDQRLRVLVGDSRKVMICNAETGEILQDLEGHRDFGFACDWADDGWTLATGNQDMQIKIWDARKWTTSQGLACPVATVATEMAGVRALKFSPLGSGKRVLVAAEPADFISVIDAETFSSKQTLSFFGEIGGFDFTNDGQDLIVGNCDNMRGGLMEFERCDFASQSLYECQSEEFGGTFERRHGRKNHGYDWRPTVEDVVNHPKSRGTAMHRRRKGAILGSMPHF